MENAAGDPDTGQKAEIPDVITVTEDGREYVVVWSHGMKGKDKLHDGQEVVQLSVFPATSSGNAATPERRITVPVDVKLSEELEVRDGGHGVLVTWGGQTAAANIRTGKVTPYEKADKLLEQCDDSACFDSKVRALTSAGPVVGTDGGKGFGVPDRWFSEDHPPRGKTSGELLAATDEHLIASWTEDDSGFGGDGSDPVFAVHDPETGAIEARTTCTDDGYSEGNIWDGGSEPPPSTSPNGRYLVAGSVAFDLKEKRGICLTGDSDTKKLVLLSVQDDGTAYGGTSAEDTDEEQSTAVAVPLTSGRPKALPEGTQVPLVVSRGTGGFLTSNKNDELSVAIVQKR
ncbi:hypothetical protein OG533_39585 (plasmid) [Streptomyces sp. NBC_01186]|uniref:hypothetical protein n=1 Tax=unclassified Streptomyces TaxID=2593676 RepID=UPI002DDAF337|nr:MULTISPECIES: hypothetical protein [unclassified Streptomyces]WSB82013.1 hypothetical protein OHB04_40480 [Streptomyces sp. NBC_01775]WSS17988.1 hypothetical protein OG533_39585 [Streptomyces sp. NBC_01186]